MKSEASPTNNTLFSADCQPRYPIKTSKEMDVVFTFDDVQPYIHPHF